ncbi:MAG: PAS domain S-box protein [Bacteroidetes bacterium]|nr:PAS domain S-box protein [Bacteroidota bacterium]
MKNEDSRSVLNETLDLENFGEKRILDLLPHAVCVCDVSGKIIHYNKKAVELWGCAPAKNEWIGSFAETFKGFYPDGTEMPYAAMPVMASLGKKESDSELEFIIERPDLKKIMVRVSTAIIHGDDGVPKGVISSFYDITERRQMEHALRDNEKRYKELADYLEKMVEQKTSDLLLKNEELKKSEERYHKMIDEVEDYAIILLDKDGIIQNWNKGAEKIKGYADDEIVGKSFKVFYQPEDRQKGLPDMLLDKAGREGKAIAEGWRVRKDGDRFWGSIVITALHDADNNVIGFTKVTRDLTAKKVAEDKLNEYSSLLEFQNKELEQFAYAASHDLKEPLRKIHLYSAYINDDASNQLTDRSRDYLGRSLRSIQQMTKLIEDLLAYSRTTSNTDSFTSVDLNEIVAAILSEHKDELEQKIVNVAVGELPVINAIPFQCKQLLDNLINNAIKYRHPDREAHVAIAAARVMGSEVRAGLSPDISYDMISIVDNGIGFDDQYADQIFEVFKRLDNSNARGSGIGLAICKKIVQNHKGVISAKGELNEGARFDIYFPRFIGL